MYASQARELAARTAGHLQATCNSLKEEVHTARMETLSQRQKAKAQIASMQAEASYLFSNFCRPCRTVSKGSDQVARAVTCKCLCSERHG